MRPFQQVVFGTTFTGILTPPDGSYYYNDSLVSWGFAGVGANKPTYNASFSFPDNVTVGPIWDFNGSNQLMTTQSYSGLTQLYLNLWFYPTAAGRIIMTIQDSFAEDTGYHHAALEINANQTISGGFWNGSNIQTITTANGVTMDSWNHVYLRHNGTQALLQLNDGTAVTSTHTWSPPTTLVLGFGTISGTNSGNNARYQGVTAEFRANNSNTANNYDATHSIYEPPPGLYYNDFTIEWWQKAESNGQNSRPWAIGLLGEPSGQVVSLSYEGNGRDYAWINSSFPAQLADRPLKNHYDIGWEHMALVRENNYIKLYSNGVNYLNWGGGNQAITSLNADLFVATGEIAAGNYTGYIKDLHVIKGYAKYTADFTPPTLPIVPQTGSVFLLPVMDAGGAFDDVIGYKSAIVSNTPTYSEDNPFSWPTQTFTAFAYGGGNIALNSPYVTDPRLGLKVSDTQGWNDYVYSLDIPQHLTFYSTVPPRDPGELYTIQEETNPLTISINYGGSGGGVSLIEGRLSQYPATIALLAVRAGWTYQDPNGGTGTITNNAYVSDGSIFLVVPDAILGTWTFTPPAYGGSLFFDAGDHISYGNSIDWAMDVDAIETNNLSLNLDANNSNSYPGTGSTWYDLSVGNSSFNLVGSPYYSAGAHASLDFNGTSQYATGPAVNMLPGSAYSKMIWFKLDDILADNNLVSSDAGGHYMYFAGGNRLWAGHSNVQPYSGPGAFGSVATFSPNTWYCVTVTYSEANGITLYINGILDNNAPMIAHTGNGSTNLACFANGGNLLNGKIGRVLCYTAELTAQQVQQNFNATRNRYDI